MTVAKKVKIAELDIVRALCILAVIIVHATSYATIQLVDSQYFVFYNFMNIFMKYGTPTFIAMSAFVLFYNYNDRPLNRELIFGFYKKRLLYILLPYFIFSLFYFTLSQFIAGSGSLWSTEMLLNFINKLITGKAYTHLYFVFINVQFYLLFPLLLLLFKKYPGLKKWSIIAGIAIQWLFILGNKYQFHVSSRGSWCFTYFSYYMLGAWLGMYYPAIKAWLIQEHREMKQKQPGQEQGSQAHPSRGLLLRGLWAIWLCSGISHTYVWYQSRVHGTQFNGLIYDFLYSVFAVTSLPVLMLAVHYLLSKKQLSSLGLSLKRLGSLSFGVYLIHPFFLLVYRQLSPAISSAWLLHLWYFGGFIAALCCSWIAVGLVARYFRYGWVFFGNLPKSNVKQPELFEHSHKFS
ncbi:Acyltransferase family protein [compost metagenome]